MGTIEFDLVKYKRLRRVYEKALKEGKGPYDTFMFDEQEFVVAYAKYVLEYLKGRFER